jgi:hypothetical protein
MKGAVLGRIVMDADPSDDGVWADFWANAGEDRRRLVAQLERRDVPLYGSSQPLARGVAKARDGHIDVWPVVYHTITTSPQNTRAVVPPLKAMLGAPSLEEIGWAAVKAALLGLSDTITDLRPTWRASGAGTSAGGLAAGVAMAGASTPTDQAVTAGIGAVVRALMARP